MRALVIGGGIGGLAAGIALRRAAVEVEVFERAAAIEDAGAGISLWANAIHALDTLGVGDVIRAASVPEKPGALRSWDGALLTTPPVAELEQRFGLFCVVLHRADLLATLFGALGPEHVRLDARCVSVRQDANGVVAEFADRRQARGDLLIGADGLHSAVRATLHGDRPPTYAGYTAWRGVVPFDTERLQAGESWGRGARFGHVRMSGGRVYWYATLNTPEGQRNADEKAALLDLFGGWHAPIPALIEATDPTAILRHNIYDRPPVKTWGKGRITLLGDAAHPMTPNLGQGGCQALEDACVLARCVREQATVEPALRAYESRRVPRTSAIVRQSRFVGRIGQWQHPLAVAARNALFRHISPRLQVKQLESIIAWTP